MTQFLGINAKPTELVFLPDLEKFSISLRHWVTNGSSAVNGCRQNESAFFLL